MTEQELEAMANALLEQDEAAHKPKAKKKSSKKKEAENNEPVKTVEERLNDLLEHGRKKGRLTTKELECLEDMNLDNDAMDKFYEALERAGVDIDIPAADALPPIDDVLPETDDLVDIEEVTEEEINEYVKQMNNVLWAKRKYSPKILENNYYAYVFK
jgi:hypothetical protein